MRTALHALSCPTLMLSLVIAVAPARGAPNPAPPTLTGELLHARHQDGGPQIGTINYTGVCGPNSTLQYSASGPAAGPYTGNFVESGAITFGDRLGEFSDEVEVLEISATFEIQSSIGDVTGTKSLDPLGSASAICEFTHTWAVTADLSYVARIHGQGTHSDQGTSTMQLRQSVTDIEFTETFASNLVQVSPGSSFPVEPGRGCGDKNHVHESSPDCP